MGDARTLAIEDDSRGSGRFHQTFAGLPILGTTGSWNAGDGDPAPYGRWAGISMSPPRDLSEALLLLAPAEAARLAVAYDRCDLDREGKTEARGYARQGEPADAGLAVLHDSLVRVVAITYTEPERSHCGLVRQVALDAETGAAHGHVVIGCD